MAISFSLITEPWIPVIRIDNSVGRMNLIEIFANADSVRQISGEVPTMRFALLRFLQAIIRGAIDGPEDFKEWNQVSQSWHLVVQAVEGYLEEYKDRFDLFDERRPFYQVAGLTTSKGEFSPVSKLICDVPANAPFFTSRINKGVESLSFAEAACWLIHAQAFQESGIRSGAIGDPRVKDGRGYPIGPGWCASIGGVLLEGGTLQEELLLNLVAPQVVGLGVSELDSAVWERELPQQASPDGEDLIPVENINKERDSRAVRGLNDLYTWQSRRIRLIPKDGRVHQVLICQGDRIYPQNKQIIEPMTAWRYSEPQTKKVGNGSPVYMPQELDPTKAIWRGLSSLLHNAPAETTKKGEAKHLPPALVKWVAHLKVAGRIDDPVIRVRHVGISLGSQQAVIEEMINDSISLPSEILASQSLATTVVDGIAKAEEIAFFFGNFANNLYLASGGDSENSGARDKAKEEIFAVLDPLFRSWIRTLAPDLDVTWLATQWQETLKREASVLHNAYLERTSEAAWAGRKIGFGDRGFYMDAGKASSKFLSDLGKSLSLIGRRDEVSSDESVSSK